MLISTLPHKSALGLAIALTCSIATANQAGEGRDGEPPEEQIDDSKVVYTAEYFAEYSPVSANDMLNSIPGVSLALRGGGGGRGLGSGAGEVLINGQRMAGKNNGGRTQLQRIAADQVDYIEIIRGTSEDLNVRGGGQIVNVVLLDSPSRSSSNLELRADRSRDGTMDPGGQFSYSGQSGDLSYLFSAGLDPNYRESRGREFSYTPLGELQETRFETEVRDETKLETSASVGYLFENSALQLNALYETKGDAPTTLNREINDLILGGTARQFEDRTSMRDLWEVGGDYEYRFDNGSTYRLLFIANDRDSEFERNRFDVVDGDNEKNLFLLNQGRDRERIVRTSYNFELDGTQGMELGIEGAQTIRDSNLRLGLAGGGATSPEFGGLVPQQVSNATSTVEEIRYEPFAVHNWQINDRMSLESTLVMETSTIEQSGDVNNSRDFEFLKPQIDYRFDITNSLQLRAGVRKDVNQLRFSDFSTSVDGGDEDQNTRAGNPEIRQEQSWRYELNLEVRLPEDLGVVNSQLWYRDLEDVIGRVDVSPSEDDLQSARGNIGDGKRYGLNLDLSTRLAMLGLPNALLTTGVRLRDSEVTDPFLGIKRREEGNGRWSTNIGFRHDMTDLGLTYGINYNNDSNGGSGRTEIDIVDTETRVEQPYMSAFIEKKAFGNVTFRLESNNLTEKEFCRVRTRFTGPTAGGIVKEIEDYCNGSGMELAFKVRTTF
ncbi:MAG: TonB-dependent receptor plug domain-containing protein [Pseudohongiellaceae bacterium]